MAKPVHIFTFRALFLRHAKKKFPKMLAGRHCDCLPVSVTLKYAILCLNAVFFQ